VISALYAIGLKMLQIRIDGIDCLFWASMVDSRTNGCHTLHMKSFVESVRYFSLPAVMLSVLFSASVMAEACTYREAIMAFERGNDVRGMVLMQMAGRDGDVRATNYLAQSFQRQEPVLSATTNNPSLAASAQDLLPE